jgi:hypothetical protein
MVNLAWNGLSGLEHQPRLMTRRGYRARRAREAREAKDAQSAGAAAQVVDSDADAGVDATVAAVADAAERAEG